MEKAFIYKQILLTNSLRKCMEISLENLDLDIIGAEKVNKLAWPALPCGWKWRIWRFGLSVVFRVWQVYRFIYMWISRVAILRVYEYLIQASLRYMYDRLLILALSLSSLLTCHTKTLGIHFREKNFSEFLEGSWDVRIYNLLRTPCKT